jgi:hypothetical protein
LNLIDFFDPTASSSINLPKDDAYNKIISIWSEFINYLPSDEARQLFSKITSLHYFKHQMPIKVYGSSDYELSDGLLMSIPIDQHIQIDELKNN